VRADVRPPHAECGPEEQIMRKTTKIAGRLALGTVLALGCASGARAADTGDAWITTKAKISLLTTSDLGATGIDVDTVDGKVTLHGTVATQAEKARAETVAKSVKGVQSVNNLLQVVSPKSEERVEAKDDQIEKRVEQALASDQRLKGSNIDVASVNNGVVLLSGKADSMNDHLEALDVTGKVPGVRRVESEVEAPDRLADADDAGSVKSTARSAASDVGDAASGAAHGVKNAAGTVADKTGAAASSAGTAMGDAYITSATKTRLLVDGDTPGTEIHVDTAAGIVTLSGIVPTTEARTAAEAEARKVTGVKGVRNELRVEKRG
jgi:osmotically-inducible protein OsmY